eukprot:TRINITY_DN14246_c0_g1_i2.p1 TRINITY_DN14246_c0_g1~~TRINITY_DN14246_c0_g1_i2.p1  ORF type:complete len:545 (-),score=126.18 TRINITY_DN14246_c0_g1_i2:273-1907(-)
MFKGLPSFAPKPRRSSTAGGGSDQQVSLREALRNRGGARAAAPAPTDIEDEEEPREKMGLDWLNLTAFSAQTLQLAIDKLGRGRADTAEADGKTAGASGDGELPNLVSVSAGGKMANSRRHSMPWSQPPPAEATDEPAQSSGSRSLRSALASRGGITRRPPPAVTEAAEASASGGGAAKLAPVEEDAVLKEADAEDATRAALIDVGLLEDNRKPAQADAEDCSRAADTRGAETSTAAPVAASAEEESPAPAGRTAEAVSASPAADAAELENEREAKAMPETSSPSEARELAHHREAEAASADATKSCAAEKEASATFPAAPAEDAPAGAGASREVAAALQAGKPAPARGSNGVSVLSEDEMSKKNAVAPAPVQVSTSPGAGPAPAPAPVTSSSAWRRKEIDPAEEEAGLPEDGRPTARERRSSWIRQPTSEEAEQAVQGSVAEPTKPKFRDLSEFWGRKSVGFAGQSLGAGNNRISRNEAQATLQRLIAAGSKVDFDEVRRLRKLISDLDGPAGGRELKGAIDDVGGVPAAPARQANVAEDVAT